jgi:hypothetical protein
MPDLQTLVSAWTRINQDHVEYFEEKDATNNNNSGGGGSSVHSGRSNLSHALNAAGIENADRSSSAASPNGASSVIGGGSSLPPPPSGSSLSSVSISKGGTIAIPARKPITPDTSSSSFATPLATRDGGGFQIQMQHEELAETNSQRQQQQQNSRRRSYQSIHANGGHNINYHNHVNALPPSQAGAAAILGYSAHHHYNNFDMAAAMGIQQSYQGEPPVSLSSSVTDAKKPAAAAAGGLTRTPSTSLWHSERRHSLRSTSSNQSLHSSRSSSNSITASLDRMNAAAQAAMAELASVNISLTNQGLANFSVSNRSAQRTRTTIADTNSANSSSSVSASAINPSSRVNFFNRPKLRKSNSRSDLVREMAIDRQLGFGGITPAQRRTLDESSASDTGSSNATPISSLNTNLGKSLMDTDPTNINWPSRTDQAAPTAFNPQTMMQEWNQSLTMRRSSQTSSGGGSGLTPVVNNQTLTSDRRTSNLSQGGNLDAIDEQEQLDIDVVNIPSQQLQRHQQVRQQHLDPSSSCDRCVQLEAAILSLQADIEYVRNSELQNEFVCKECERGPPPTTQTSYSAASLSSRGSRSSQLPRRKSVSGEKGSVGDHVSRTAAFLRDASRRLNDLSIRHKKEVKQSLYERAYWQNDMHLKLEKFAMMCKNLNEDAAQRSNEVKELKSKLEMVTTERNGLVTQVESLKARVTIYEGESVVQSRLRDNFERGEAKALDSFDKAMNIRYETIKDLSNRLNIALEEVERNRNSNSIRRQIIFPSQRSMSSQSATDVGSAPSSPKPLRPSSEHGQESEHGASAKLAERAKLSLEAAMIQSAAREMTMQKRLDALEQELEQARAILRGNEHYLEGELSLKHATSTSSL